MPVYRAPLYKSCDMVALFRGAKDYDDNPINNATATFSIVDESDDSVLASGTVPYVALSDGLYRTTIDKSVLTGVVPGRDYLATLVFTGTGGEETTEYLHMVGVLKGRR